MIGFWDRFRFLCRMTAPGLVALALVILSAVNMQAHGLSVVMPLFPLMVVYYWAIYWPEAAPRWFVFVLGLFQDIVHAAPLGISSLLLLLMWWIVTGQRRHLLKEPFIIIWLMFGISAGLYMTGEWLLQFLISGHAVMDEALAVRLLLSVLFYPAIHKLLNSLHKVVLQK